MARSTCIKCGNTSFEIVEATPAPGKYNVWFVQCASCGGVINAMEYKLVGGLIVDLAKKLNVSL